MAESTHAQRFAAAQADYHTAVGHDPHRVWATILFLLTATDDLWRAYSPHLAYKSETATFEEALHVSPAEQLVVSVAQNLAGDFATTSTRTVDLAACCLQMDDHTFEVVVAACRMLRGNSGAARKLLEP
jgi:hypothetical protein